MVEPPDHRKLADTPRGDPEPAWEVLIRSEDSAPMHHVGSVLATDAEAAYRNARRLFGWYASEIWVTPASSVTRFTDHHLATEAQKPESSESDEPRTIEP